MLTDPASILFPHSKLAPAFLSVFANLTKSRSHSPQRGSDSHMGQQSSKKGRKAAKEKDKDASSDGPSPDNSPEAAQPALSRPDDVSASTTNGSEPSLNGNPASSELNL